MKTRISAFMVAGWLCSLLSAAMNADLKSVIRPWGRETVQNTRNFFSGYESILLLRVDQDHWVSNKPPELSAHHYQGMVLKTYKGGWRASEKISLVTFHDGPAPATPAKGAGELLILLTNAHPGSEVAADTGELLRFRKDLEPALDYFYSRH